MFLNPLLTKILNDLPKRSNRRQVIEPLITKTLEFVNQNFNKQQLPPEAQNIDDSDSCIDSVKSELGPEKWSELISNITETLLVCYETSGVVQIAETSILSILKLIDKNYIEGRIMTEKIVNRILNSLKSYVDNYCIIVNILSIFGIICSRGHFQVHDSFFIKIILSTYNIANLNFSEKEIERIAKDTLYEIVSTRFRSISSEIAENDDKSPSSLISTQNFKECTNVFLLLCKLSLRDYDKKFSEKPRSLALKILLYILSDNLCNLKRINSFIETNIKKHLMQVLFANVCSEAYSIFRLTISIFTLIIKELGNLMKPEIESILYYVYVYLLSSNAISRAYCIEIALSLIELFKSPQITIDLYINYDYNIPSYNIVEYLIDTLSKIAQKKVSFNDDFSETTLNKEFFLKEYALEACLTLFSSLSAWIEFKSPNILHSHEPSHDFRQIHKMKQTLEEAKLIFNQSYSKGLQILFEESVIPCEPWAIAAFLFYIPELDKFQVGELISGTGSIGNALIKDILMEYIKLIPLSREIELALKEFVYCFELPKEGQKIERLLSSFGEVYYELYPDCGIDSVDSAFFLATSILMYSTSVHNRAISNADKLNRADWKKLMLGQNSGKNFDDGMLDRIADIVENEEFRIKEEFNFAQLFSDSKKKSPIKLENDLKRMAMDFLELRKSMESSDHSIELMTFGDNSSLSDRGDPNGSTTTNTFFNINSSTGIMDDFSDSELNLGKYTKKRATKVRLSDCKLFSTSSEPDAAQVSEYVYHLFLSMNERVRAAFDSNIDIFPLKCFGGLLHGLHICSLYGIFDETAEYLQRIVHNSSLNNSDVSKTIFGIKTLLTVAEKESNIKGNWTSILNFISLLQSVSNDSYNIDNENTYLFNEELVSYVKTIKIDRTFIATTRLSDPEFLEFFKALCDVSFEELKVLNLFSLQKLVEIIDFNLIRPHNVWIYAWKDITDYFLKVCTLDIDEKAWILVDSLRQMTEKLLNHHKKDQFINLQPILLKPYDLIYQNFNIKIREYLIHCIAAIISAHHSTIKEGWIHIFSLFGKVSLDKCITIMELVLSLLEKCLDIYIDDIIINNILSHLIKSIVQFVSNSNSHNIIIKSLKLLFKCSGKLVDHQLPSSEPDPLPENYDQQTNKIRNFPEYSSFWIQIFSGFTFSITNHDVNIRSTAINYFFELLNTHGIHFDKSFWKLVFFQVLFKVLNEKILDHIKEDYILEDSEWLVTACLKYSQNIFILFGNHYDTLNFLLPDLLSLLERMTLQNNEKLATSGIACLETLIAALGSKIKYDGWESIIECIRIILLQNFNQDLCVVFKHMDPSNPNAPKEPPTHKLDKEDTNPKADSDDKSITKKIILGKLWIKNQVIKIVKENVIVPFFLNTNEQMISIDQIFKLAKIYLKYFKKPYKTLIESGSSLTDEQILNSLLKLEMDSIQTYIKIVFDLESRLENSSYSSTIQNLIFQVFELLIPEQVECSKRYNSLSIPLQNVIQVNETFIVSAIIALLEMKKIDTYLLKRLYPLMIRLCLTDNVEIRERLNEYLLKIGTIVLEIPQEMFEIQKKIVDSQSTQ